jgi:SAM-dependent methyltransferase
MVKDREEFVLSIKNTDKDDGWGFGQGDPEFWRFQEHLLVPGGNLLDLGAGTGRSCMFFAMNGMNVTAYESSYINAQILRRVAKQGDLPIEVKRKDFETSKLGREVYDTIILDSTLVHSPSKENAIQLLNKTVDALKPDGHIYVRTIGKEDDTYYQLASFAKHNPSVETDVFSISCGCSGEFREEPILFFNQTDLLQYCLIKGMKIVHHQCMPEYGRMNTMFGEDWQGQSSQWNTNGAITIIAQKK